ncbi:prepilin-type N-terminal cleavage/methylation domain-containing protein [Caldicellulosiruptor acetigenus]|uniref:Prepilin-type N-terminal cleavage/methylation domain-containing protein n=1 Tax=Caldicellulosiruptor acetigenus 6A TaxID=632516 RepID=G2PZ76_9FIRM|nr:prepilin-type N-terminal cleavage/methylation domain-containing protein [Caldicellulosiruptor acetigenus]AEM74121.1 hypothetical protein Calla_1513 [Caldicellulosiruptor acetigenus 6A]
MKKRGFSLPEMIAVIAIIAILLAIGIPNYIASVRREEVRSVANFLADAIIQLYDLEDKKQDYNTYFLKIVDVVNPATSQRELTISLIKYQSASETVIKERTSKVAELDSSVIVTGIGSVATYLYFDKEGRLCRFSGSPGLRSNQATYYTEQQITVKVRGGSGGYQKRVIIKPVPAGSVEVK